MSYAILRFDKLKANLIGSIESHHERLKDNYISNPDIDVSKSKLNYHFKKPDEKYKKEIDSRIQKANCKVRSNSIKLVDTLITSGNEFFLFNSEKEYFEKAYEFMCSKIGEENIVSAVIHLDEKTPHLHLTFVPITDDKRLSAKDIIGNRTKLIKWQDEFHAHMKKSFEELERGKAAAETKRKHIPTNILKKSDALLSTVNKIQTVFENLSANFDTENKDEIKKLLKTFMSGSNIFISDLNDVRQKIISDLNNIDVLEKELNQKEKSITARLDSKNNIYKKPFDELQKKYSRLENHNRELTKKYNQVVKIVNLLPPDLIKKIDQELRRGKDDTKIEL